MQNEVRKGTKRWYLQCYFDFFKCAGKQMAEELDKLIMQERITTGAGYYVYNPHTHTYNGRS